MSFWGNRDVESPHDFPPSQEHQPPEPEPPAGERSAPEPEPPAGERSAPETEPPAGETEPPAGERSAPEPEPAPDGEQAPAVYGVILDAEAAVKGGFGGHGQAPSPPATPSGSFQQVWREIQANFVDDPRGSVNMAADAVNMAVEEFMASVRTRQASLASAWQGSDTDTERLRAALRDYRAFWTTLHEASIS